MQSRTQLAHAYTNAPAIHHDGLQANEVVQLREMRSAILTCRVSRNAQLVNQFMFVREGFTASKIFSLRIERAFAQPVCHPLAQRLKLANRCAGGFSNTS